MTKYVRVLCAVSLLLLFQGCSSGRGEIHDYYDQSYSFWLTTRDHIFSYPGEQFIIKYHMKPIDIPITWESTDLTVAVVDEDGIVTAIGPGECRIIYTTGYEDIGLRTGNFNVQCEFEDRDNTE